MARPFQRMTRKGELQGLEAHLKLASDFALSFEGSPIFQFCGHIFSPCSFVAQLLRGPVGKESGMSPAGALHLVTGKQYHFA